MLDVRLPVGLRHKPVFAGSVPAAPQPSVTAESAQTQSFNTAQAAALKNAVMFSARKPHFGSAVLNDRHVELRVDTPLNSRTVAKVLHNLVFQRVAKGNEGTLKLLLNAYSAPGYKYMDEAALADSLTLIDRPVDVVLTHYAGPASVRTLVSATGKRFMTVGAELTIGPFKSIFGTRKSNDDAQNYRRLYNSYQRDLEWLIMQRTGEKSRVKVHNDLESGRGLTSLESLAYGKNGFVDYILVGHDKVITRQNLEDAYAKFGITTEKDKQRFNQNLDNIDRVETTPIKDVAPESLPKTELAPFKSLKAVKAENAARKEKAEADKTKRTAQKDATAEKKLTLNLPTPNGSLATIEEIPSKLKVEDKKGNPIPDQYLLENVPEGFRSILNGDVINLNAGFDVDTGEKIVNALRYLAQEKLKNNDKTPIRLLVNSPGGAVLAGHEIRDTIAAIADQGVKTDVIAYGMASSCGSWTLSSSSGSRLATPGARVMIHQANGVPGSGISGDLYNANADGLNNATETYQRIVAKASGRPYDEVATDFRTDTWYNPVESLFYGPKGLIDGILVGPDKVVTRDAVEKYLIKKFGSREKMEQRAEEAINNHRNIETSWDPADHDEKDPFKNPLKTIAEVVARGGAVPLSAARLPQLKASMPSESAKDSIEYFNVTKAPGEE